MRVSSRRVTRSSLPYVVQQLADEVQRRDAAAPFGGVHVAVDDERGLLQRGPGGAVGQRQEPDRAALRRGADALELDEVRALVRPLLQELGQLLVAQDVVERQRGDRLRARVSAKRERQNQQCRPHGRGDQNLRVTLAVTRRRVP